MVKYCLFTTDVETTSIWFNDLRDETGIEVLREGMPLLLDIYARYGIKTTFFFTGYIAGLYPDVVRMVLKDGHEVGSHGKSYLPENGFDVLSFDWKTFPVRRLFPFALRPSEWGSILQWPW